MDTKIEKKKYPIKSIFGFILATIGIAFLFYTFYFSNQTTTLRVAENRILFDTVHHGSFQEFIAVTGIVQPIKTVFLDAIEGGKVEEVLVEDGTVLKQGQVILKLSNYDLQMSYLNQEAQTLAQINNIRNTSILMEQQSLRLEEQALEVIYRIDQLEKDIKRNKILLDDQVIARVDYERIEDEYEHLLRRRKLMERTIRKDSLFQELQKDQMESSLALMNNNLEIAKNGLTNLVVKAPIAGQLSSFDIEIGELLQKGENIAQIDAIEHFKITAKIDEYYISRIFVGQQASWTKDGQIHLLQIRKIYPEVVNGSFQVDLIFENEAPALIRRGQSIYVKMELSNKIKTLQLAKGSFYQFTGGNWVYLFDPATKKAIKRTIKIGRQNPNNYEILDGLKVGDIIINSNYESFNNMDELQIN